MIVKKLEETARVNNPHNVESRNLCSREEVSVTVVTLQPGESLKKHITPVDVLFYVLEGQGIVQIGDEKQLVTKDSLVESPRDIMHCWYNESSSPVKFMVIKAPKPTEKTVFID